jgi:hypothetical protein
MNKKVYIGYDTREDIAYQVSKYSILNKSKNIEVNPLKLSELKDKKLYWRDEDNLAQQNLPFLDF